MTEFEPGSPREEGGGGEPAFCTNALPPTTVKLTAQKCWLLQQIVCLGRGYPRAHSEFMAVFMIRRWISPCLWRDRLAVRGQRRPDAVNGSRGTALWSRTAKHLGKEIGLMSSRLRNWSSAILLVLFVALLPRTAWATSVTYDFSGVVISAVIPAFPTTFVGSMTFNDATPDSDPSLTVGSYVGAVTSFLISFEGNVFASVGPSAGDITVGGPLYAGSAVEFGPFGPLSGSFSGLSLNYLKIVIPLGGGDSLSNASNFLTSLPILQADFYNGALFESAVVGDVISSSASSPAAVPEPTSVLLLGAGFLALGIRRRWTTRRS